MADDVCPDCGGALRLEDKHTFTGNEWREYRCVKCGREVVEDRGKALWQILHDDAEERRAAQAAAVRRRWWQFWKR